MMFANTLPKNILTVGGWLMLGLLAVGGCRPLPQQLKNNAKGAAGASADPTKTSTGKNATTGTAKGAAGAAAPADTANSGGTTTNGTAAAAGSVARPAAAAAAAAGAGAATPAANAKAIPACEGKADEYACDGVMLYHCVNGAYEGRPTSCKTEAQCTAGLTTGQCGECDPGTFQCLDVELQSCDATGAWVLSMECASAKLCKEDMGICDTQVCHEDEYRCTGDQLETCNADFSDFLAQGASCDPGLCSVAAEGCLECLPSTPAACSDERTQQLCTADGMLDQKPCAGTTPFCAEGACVQCNAAADCGPSMNDCGTLTCTSGMCTPGDPKPQGTACTSNGGKICDFLGTCVTCVTDLDCNDSKLRCYLGVRCVPKDAITATPLFSTWSVTVSPGFRGTITNSSMPYTGVVGNELNSSQASDGNYLLSIAGHSACGLLPQVASGDGSTITLGFSDNMAPDTGGLPSCQAAATITIVAHKL